MSEDKKVYTTVDAVNLAADGNVNEFKSAVGDIMMDKIQSAIEIKKYEVQSNFMATQDTAEE
tara:strand:+ start:284 stop:469 length:186 start_codon:yes stop_codon:yes gene_type:complete